MSFISVTQWYRLCRPTSHIFNFYSSRRRQFYRYLSERSRYLLKELQSGSGHLPSPAGTHRKHPRPWSALNTGRRPGIDPISFYQSFAIIQSVFIGCYPIFNSCFLSQRYSSIKFHEWVINDFALSFSRIGRQTDGQTHRQSYLQIDKPPKTQPPCRWRRRKKVAAHVTFTHVWVVAGTSQLLLLAVVCAARL